MERAAFLGLLEDEVNTRRWRFLTDQVEELGSAIAVMNGELPQSFLDRQLHLFPPEAKPIKLELDRLAEKIDRWDEAGYRFLTILDDEYPPNLRDVYNRPPFLFVRGELHESDSRALAIIGTRSATREGRARARRLARELSEAGLTIVSGLAKGIDTEAHTTTLDLNRRTLAVIGTGVTRCYPRENEALQERIARVGAVLSQFWPDDPPAKYRFPMRNKVMSGIALGTVVVEASNKSGARLQATYALDHGRPVFLLQSLLEHEWAREFAERPGCTVISDTNEILKETERIFNPPMELVGQ